MTKKVDFDSYVSNYNSLLQESTGFFSSSEEYFARYKAEITRGCASRPVGRILEFGCGIGRNIPFLKEQFPGSELVGTDISAASIDAASALNPGVQFEVEVDGLDIGFFDLIFVAGVFHHIHPGLRAAVMKTVVERLAGHGVVIVFEHNPFNPVTRRIVSNCPYDEDAVLLKPRELVGLLVGNGLSIRRRSFCLFVPPWLSFLAPIEKHLGWLPLGGQYYVEAVR